MLAERRGAALPLRRRERRALSPTTATAALSPGGRACHWSGGTQWPDGIAGICRSGAAVQAVCWSTDRSASSSSVRWPPWLATRWSSCAPGWWKNIVSASFAWMAPRRVPLPLLRAPPSAASATLPRDRPLRPPARSEPSLIAVGVLGPYRWRRTSPAAATAWRPRAAPRTSDDDDPVDERWRRRPATLRGVLVWLRRRGIAAQPTRASDGCCFTTQLPVPRMRVTAHARVTNNIRSKRGTHISLVRAAPPPAWPVASASVGAVMLGVSLHAPS